MRWLRVTKSDSNFKQPNADMRHRPVQTGAGPPFSLSLHFHFQTPVSPERRERYAERTALVPMFRGCKARKSASRQEWTDNAFRYFFVNNISLRYCPKGKRVSAPNETLAVIRRLPGLTPTSWLIRGPPTDDQHGRSRPRHGSWARRGADAAAIRQADGRYPRGYAPRSFGCEAARS